jgi:hypothetical protein
MIVQIKPIALDGGFFFLFFFIEKVHKTDSNQLQMKRKRYKSYILV